jgi:hypothetical protein
MDAEDDGCDALHATYLTARPDDVEGMQQAWTATDTQRLLLGSATLDQLESAVADGDSRTVRETTSDHLFGEVESPTLDVGHVEP